MLRFVMSGGNFIFSAASWAGIWTSSTGFVISASAPAGAGDSYAFQIVGGNPQFLRPPDLGGNFSGLIAGVRMNVSALVNNTQLLVFRDSTGANQCDLRMNAAGQLFFTRNGTVIGSTSTFALTPGVWFYLEFKALFSTSAGGTCEARVNSVAVVTSTGLTNATGTAAAALVDYAGQPGWYFRDFYALDTGTGANVSYLGDINVVELYPDGPGVNSAWTANVGPFSITSVANASGGNTVYTGTITGGAGNAYVGYNFTPSGFAHAANNVGGSNPAFFECVASTATSITLNNPSGVSDTTGSMPFQCIVQTGAINKTGTRPNGDVAYISDSTTNDISDFAHTPLTLTGVIFGVSHLSYLRKDDLGIRQVAQVCLSASATEVGPTISLGNTYQYFADVIEVDPNTSTQFSVSGFNAATLGIKEIT
jgi:hypothetical protein